MSDIRFKKVSFRASIDKQHFVARQQRLGVLRPHGGIGFATADELLCRPHFAPAGLPLEKPCIDFVDTLPAKRLNPAAQHIRLLLHER